MLIKDSLALAKKMGYSRILLIGDLSYYGRLGFKKLTNIKMPKPTNPDRILGIELISGAAQNCIHFMRMKKVFHMRSSTIGV